MEGCNQIEAVDDGLHSDRCTQEKKTEASSPIEEWRIQPIQTASP